MSLGRLNITTSVMPMPSFRVEPREGHVERLNRMCGCLLRFKCAAIRIRHEEPDLSDVTEKVCDWGKSVHCNVREVLLTDAPEHLGSYVVTISYHDDNLHHTFLTGISVTGVLRLVTKKHLLTGVQRRNLQ